LHIPIIAFAWILLQMFHGFRSLHQEGSWTEIWTLEGTCLSKNRMRWMVNDNH